MIRLAWLIMHQSGVGDWQPDSDRDELEQAVEDMCALYGEGSHWIEEKQ